MLDFGRFIDRGRILLGLLLVVPVGVIVSTPNGGSSSAAPTAQWVAEYGSAATGADGTSAAQILDQFAAGGGVPASVTDGQTIALVTEAQEGELTTPLPADYQAGGAPEAGLAATLRRAQQRNTRVVAPTAKSAALALASNPRVIYTRQSQINDLRSGTVDPRIVDVLTWIANRRASITITSVRTDHSVCVAGSSPCRVSAHNLGRAIDIAAVNGEPCRGTPSGQCGVLFEEIVNILRGTQYQPSQVIYGYDKWPSERWNFAMGNHHDHIHLGF